MDIAIAMSVTSAAVFYETVLSLLVLHLLVRPVIRSMSTVYVVSLGLAE